MTNMMWEYVSCSVLVITQIRIKSFCSAAFFHQEDLTRSIACDIKVLAVGTPDQTDRMEAVCILCQIDRSS